LRVPLTLSICNALCCLSQQGRIAFPMDGIEDTKSVMLSDIMTDADGNRSVNWNNCVIPLHHLADLLKYNGQLHQNQVYDTAPSRDRVSLILVRGIGSEHLAIQVDQVIGEEEIVMKQIDGPIPIPPGLAGVTVRANGSIMPIGDVLALIDIAQGRLRCEQSPDLGGETLTALVNAPPMNPTVFIVDDSITVRELLSLSFKKAGFRVEQARDGQEAWERLKSGLFCDLILCDIEMPRMNGLELLDCIQADAKLSSIPIAMITSRGGSKMQRLAAAKGARGYFVKPYIEERLLEASQRLIKGDILLEMATLGEEAEA
ncbi:MAG: hypothetical protein RLZZ568_718, partial [Cyanobacteriota bacterium]